MHNVKPCPYCGEDISEDTTVCPICGEELTEYAEELTGSGQHDEPEPTNSSGGRESFAPLLDSIYWDQKDSRELVYKYPKNGITTGCVLTVRESQEAYFFRNGVLCDKFTAGRHRLSSQNLPILNKLVNLPSHGETTFLAEVWFISKLEKRDCLWGTGGMRIIDPYFQIPVKVSSRGQYGIRIDDGAMFLKKLVGTIKTSEAKAVEQQFRTDVIESARISIARYMKERNLNINELGTEYRNVARFVSQDLQESFDEYGIELLNFNIEDISIDENDAGYKKVMEGVAENARLKHLGVDYLQQKNIDIAQTAAGNEGAGNLMGVGMGLGVGQQMGQIVSEAIQRSGIATPPPPPPPANASFYVALNGQTTGPFNLGRIREMIINGQIDCATFVYRLGGSTWKAAETEPEIARLFASLLPPPPPPTI